MSVYGEFAPPHLERALRDRAVAQTLDAGVVQRDEEAALAAKHRLHVEYCLGGGILEIPQRPSG